MSMKDGFGIKRKDWKSDPRVRLLSLAVRGLYAELAAWAMDSARRGYLTMNGAALGWVDMARLVGAEVGEVRDGVDVLRAAGLVDMARDGTLFLPVIVKAAARSEKNRINALAGVQSNLFEKQVKPEVAQQTDDCAVVSIASAKRRPKGQKKNPPHPLKENNNIYIYTHRVSKSEVGNPIWVELDHIRFRKNEYQAILDQLPVTDDQLMDMLARQDRWLADNPAYQQNWLAATLKYLKLVTNGTGVAAA